MEKLDSGMWTSNVFFLSQLVSSLEFIACHDQVGIFFKMPENEEKNTTCANLVQTPRLDEEAVDILVVTNSACNFRIFRSVMRGGMGNRTIPEMSSMNLQ